jgi:hypothetical protein
MFKTYIYVTRNMEIAFNHYAPSQIVKSRAIPMEVKKENTYYKHYEINFTQR